MMRSFDRYPMSGKFRFPSLKKIALWAAAMLALSQLGAPSALAAPARDARQSKPETVKIGFVVFLSGGAASTFGIPARNAAALLVEAVNDGSLPIPYARAGFHGLTIEPVFVDENSKQKVADYQKLIQKNKVDIVIGYISSASCKAVAPVAEEMKTLTILFDCGTPQIFEKIIKAPKYTFRTGAHATMDNIAAARYLIDTGAKVERIAGINQNYAWGRDSWRDFSASMKELRPKSKIVSTQFPKIFAGQYGSEISSLLTRRADVIHSSFWGGDMDALIVQGGARRIFERSKVVFTTGETAMHRLASRIPQGTIIGARGPHGELAPESELNDWFRSAYYARFGMLPTYPSYKMAQAILGLKAAADRAGTTKQSEMIKALRGSKWKTPSGTVDMALAGGHQAIQNTAYGTFAYDPKSGKAELTNIIRYKAECVNPPEGTTSIDWIESGFKGADCT